MARSEVLDATEFSSTRFLRLSYITVVFRSSGDESVSVAFWFSEFDKDNEDNSLDAADVIHVYDDWKNDVSSSKDEGG